MSVYILKKNANDYRVLSPVKYAGAQPVMPLFNQMVFRKNHYYHNNAATQPGEAVSVWEGLVPSLCSLRRSGTGHEVVYDKTSFGESGGGWGNFDNGDDDGLTAGADSADFRRHGSTGTGQKIWCDITVPEGWESACVVVTTAFNAGTSPDGAWAMRLFNGSHASLGSQVTGLGRGIMRLNPVWASGDAAGDTDWWDVDYAMVPQMDEDGLYTTLANPDAGFKGATIELARGITPGDYCVEMEKLITSTWVGMSRVWLIRQYPKSDLDPSTSGAALYFDEILRTADYLAANDALYSGPTGLRWSSYTCLSAKISSPTLTNDVYSGGSSHGFEKQVSASFEADGSDIAAALSAAADGTILGPYNEVNFTFENTQHLPESPWTTYFDVTYLWTITDEGIRQRSTADNFVDSDFTRIYLGLPGTFPRGLSPRWLGVKCFHANSLIYANSLADRETTVNAISDSSGEPSGSSYNSATIPNFLIYTYSRVPLAEQRNVGRDLIIRVNDVSTPDIVSPSNTLEYGSPANKPLIVLNAGDNFNGETVMTDITMYYAEAGYTGDGRSRRGRPRMRHENPDWLLENQRN